MYTSPLYSTGSYFVYDNPAALQREIKEVICIALIQYSYPLSVTTGHECRLHSFHVTLCTLLMA